MCLGRSLADTISIVPLGADRHWGVSMSAFPLPLLSLKYFRIFPSAASGVALGVFFSRRWTMVLQESTSFHFHICFFCWSAKEIEVFSSGGLFGCCCRRLLCFLVAPSCDLFGSDGNLAHDCCLHPKEIHLFWFLACYIFWIFPP